VAVELYLLPAPGAIPAVLCLGLGDGRTWPAAHVGVAADPDPVTAARKAVYEHTYSAVYYARLMRDGDCPDPPAPEAVTTFADHALHYTRSGALPAFDQLRSASRDAPPPATGDPLDALAGAGVRLAAVDLTSADLHAAPLRVVRVLSPDLAPLHAGSRHALRNSAGPEPTPGRPHPLC
jgi:ribosomal protein S12 methylthiotransferase accessory factor